MLSEQSSSFGSLRDIGCSRSSTVNSAAQELVTCANEALPRMELLLLELYGLP